MSTFAFKALDLTGAATRGEVEAEDKQTVAAQLRAKGLIVLDIEEQKPTDVGDLLGRFKKVKAHELTVATRQLSTMISSGMSLLRALYVLEDQAENDKLKETCAQVRKDVEAGISLSEALGAAPRHLQRALHRDGGGRRDRRHPGGDARAASRTSSRRTTRFAAR